MSLAVDTDKCMFFVGGNKAKSQNPTGQNLSGGCTKAWWDAAVAADDAETAMGKLMGTDGQPVHSNVTVTHTEVSGGEFNGKTKLTASIAELANAEAGMILFHSNSVGPILPDGPGMYKILWSQGFQEVIIDIDWEAGLTGNDGSSVNVGGAWNDLSALLQSYIDADAFTQEVWVNRNFIKSSAVSTASWGNGHKLKNTWLKLRGFERTPWDMHPGGAYYQSAFGKLISGLDSTAAVNFDFQQNDCHGLLVDGSYNLLFECMNWGNVYYDNVADKAGVYRQNNPENIIFNYCSATGGRNCFYGNGRGVFHYDCYADITGYTPTSSGYGFKTLAGTDVFTVYDTCIVKLDQDEGFYCNTTNDVLINCLTVNGNRGMSAPFGGKQYVKNCTFYNQVICAIRGGSITTDGLIVVRGNINLLTAQADWAYELHSSGGTIFEDYNDNYSLAGILTALGNNPYAGGSITEEGQNSLQVDPDLDSTPASKYEPLEEQIRTGGTPDILGDATSMGAINAMNTSVIEAAAAAALVTYNLDHLMKVPVADRADMAEVVDDTVLANLMTKTDGDTSDFVPGTDSLEAISDALPSVTDILGGTIEGTLTLQEAISVLVALAAGKCDGGATATIHFRNQADDTDRITMIVDTEGDRSATTIDVTDL